MVRRGLGLHPSVDGVSDIWRRPDGVVLLLGNAANAAAAVDNELGIRVSHIVCVASSRNARTLQKRLLERNAGEVTCTGTAPSLQVFPMSDRLQPDEEVNLAKELAAPMRAIELACASGGEASPRDHLWDDAQAGAADRGVEAESQEPGMNAAADRAVLVNCDMGHNRGPTLVLAFLVYSGLSLREAYRTVLRARPHVDPLPAYREALRAYELQAHGVQTVSGTEVFSLHISQLMCLSDSDSDAAQEREVFQQAIAFVRTQLGDDTQGFRWNAEVVQFFTPLRARSAALRDILEAHGWLSTDDVCNAGQQVDAAQLLEDLARDPPCDSSDDSHRDDSNDERADALDVVGFNAAMARRSVAIDELLRESS